MDMTARKLGWSWSRPRGRAGNLRGDAALARGLCGKAVSPYGFAFGYSIFPKGEYETYRVYLDGGEAFFNAKEDYFNTGVVGRGCLILKFCSSLKHVN